MPAQRLLDFAGKDLQAAAVDELRATGLEPEEPVLVEAAEVAGAQQAVGREPGGIGVGDVPGHHIRRRDADLADFAGRNRLATVTEDPDFDARMWSPHRAELRVGE